MSNKKTLFWIAGTLVVAAGGYFGLSSGHGPADMPADVASAEGAALEAKASRPAISVATVQTAVLKDRVRASGLVGAVERVLVQPQVEGQAIDAILAEVGDHVAEGAVLARLSDTALLLQKSQLTASRANALAMIAQSEAQLVDANASAAEAKRNADRAEQLRKQGNASQAAADQAATSLTSANARVMVATQGAVAAKAQLELVDAQIANVELQLSRTEIKAPFAGEVVEKKAVAGAIASAAGQPMFVIVRDGLLELNADVGEQDLPRVASGQQVSLRAAGQREPLTGVVRLVEPTIDPLTRLGRVRITLDQPDRVRSGTFLETEIEISTREVVAVPINALGTDSEGAYLMTVDAEGKVHRTDVVTGVQDGGMIEIESGVAAGDLVVAKAASFVRDGDLVDAVPADPAGMTN
ncbi:efflux RND transporter periplasmic adaptor subunit [Frigidibacter sp. RF13]|uniref:efflux RND transporter periplasmic adaptor subunit n=1 Tax=Frigidibacter sp. RF13 TaxID=2997340 RepID=UPI00226E0AD8|nr:efflux RND transporter periplasmic adaptor subunit [Frigidibacter sp. RF13]MCY1125259.1 efflux RND transporter periplasmic adaptor subunit [Frigidibacter sp. RF13]